MSEKLKELTVEQLAKLFNERMKYMYLTVPEYEYHYPNSYDGDCLKIAHVLAAKVLKGDDE